ncbi:MAG: trigger factor, partial [Bacteroidota bacterium]
LILESEDYKPQLDAQLKEQAKKAQMPGFRPGKVPINLVRKMVGKGLVIDVVSKVVQEELDDYIKGENLNILGNPLPTEQKTEEDFDPTGKREMEFKFEVGMAPEFDFKLDLPEVPFKYQIEIDDAYMNKDVDHFRERFGGVTMPEAVEEGDIFYGKLAELDEEGNEVEDGFNKSVPFNPLRLDQPEFLKQFEGAKVEDTFTIQLANIGATPEKISECFFMEAEEVERLWGTSLKMEVARITRLGIAAFNEEFFQRMAQEFNWSEEEIEGMTEESFKEKMKERLSTDLDEPAKWDYRNRLRDALLAYNTLDLPEAFLKKFMLESQKGITPEQVEEEYPEFAKSQSWTLMIDKVVADRPELKISEEELNEDLIANLRRTFLQYGSPLPPDREEEMLK